MQERKFLFNYYTDATENLQRATERNKKINSFEVDNYILKDFYKYNLECIFAETFKTATDNLIHHLVQWLIFPGMLRPR